MKHFAHLFRIIKAKFKIMGGDKNSTANKRMKIQDLIESNTVRANGDFHSDNLDESNFIIDLHNNFKFIPKEEGEDVDELLNKILKVSTKKVIGMINSKELKQSKFLKELFEKFEIERI